MSLSHWFLHGMTNLQPEWLTQSDIFVAELTRPRLHFLKVKTSMRAWRQLGYSTGNGVSYDRRAVLGTA